MNTSPIGIFDSGLGGLCAVREFLRLLPKEDLVYFGDTGRVPYGTRSKETIVRYSMQDMKFLYSHAVKAVVIACGTASSTAIDTLKQNFDIPIFGVIDPAVRAAAGATKNGKIAVIGTSATVNSNSYANALSRLDGGFSITSAACPLFIPLVENGFIEKDNEVTLLVAKKYLEPIKKSGADTLILGCTHFPLIKDIISAVLPGVTLIDTGAEAIRALSGFLSENSLLSQKSEKGNCKFFVSDKPSDFSLLASRMLGCDLAKDAEKVNIEDYD